MAKIPVIDPDNSDLNSDWIQTVRKTDEGTEKQQIETTKVVIKSRKSMSKDEQDELYAVSDGEIEIEKKAVKKT